MKKHFPHISALILTFVLVYTVSGFLFPQTAHADYCLIDGKLDPVISDPAVCQNAGGVWHEGTPPAGTKTNGWLSGLYDIASDILLAPLGWLAIMILQLAVLITWLGGTILNFIVDFTIVHMKDNIEKANTVSLAWGTIRDVANMGFIFILLYAGIKTILGIGDDTKKLIVNIVIVAILINFSLFFTKVVIDASNVLAITFYDAIAPASLTDSSENLNMVGIAGKLMKPLYITSLWDSKDICLSCGKQTIIIGVMGTIVALIAAFIFFAIAIMFVIRFVVLIFVLILSPLAFLGFILPALKSQKDQWVQALLGQAFFAPIYFMLTWIVIIIVQGLYSKPAGVSMAKVFLGSTGADGETVTPPSVDNIGILLNFIIVIVFLIASLIIAKQWADKAGRGVQGLTKWASGASFGLAGRLGRNTVGRMGAAVGESEWLKKKADSGSMAARLSLAAGRKTGGASFDVRGGPLGGTLDAGKAQKGGFTQWKKDKAEREAKFAESLAPSAKAVAKNPALLGDKAEVEERVKEREKAKQTMISNAKDNEELKSAELRERSAHDTISRLEAEVGATEGTAKQGKVTELETAKAALIGIQREASEARRKTKEEVDTITARQDAEIKAIKIAEIKATSEIRKDNFARAVEQSFLAKARGYNYDAAAKIRKGKKTAKELVDELLAETGEKAKTPPPTEPVTQSPASSATSPAENTHRK